MKHDILYSSNNTQNLDILFNNVLTVMPVSALFLGGRKKVKELRTVGSDNEKSKGFLFIIRAGECKSHASGSRRHTFT